MSNNQSKLSRRDLLKAAAIGGLGAATLRAANIPNIEAPKTHNETMIGVKLEPRNVVRIGIVGVGLRGTSVLGEFLAIDNVKINAVCDVVKEKCLRAAQLVEKAGQKSPAIYADGETAF